MPFDRPDLLRQADYRGGDVLPVQNVGRGTGSNNQSTTSTTFVATYSPHGDIDLSLPNPRLRFLAFLSNSNAGDTTIARPQLQDSTQDNESLDELEVSNTGSGDLVDSDWQQPASVTPDDIYRALNVQLRVDGGTGTIQEFSLLIGTQL